MRFNRILTACLAVGAIALGGCGYREVDVNVTGAEKVPGAGELYVMCTPEGTAIYFTKYGGSEDNYEAFFANACYRDAASGRIVFTYDRPAQPLGSSTPIADGDLGNSQPGTEEDN